MNLSKAFRLVFVATCFVGATAAHAEDGDAPCMGDVAKFCSDNDNSDPQFVIKCLHRHRDEVTDVCRTSLNGSRVEEPIQNYIPVVQPAPLVGANPVLDATNDSLISVRQRKEPPLAIQPIKVKKPDRDDRIYKIQPIKVAKPIYKTQPYQDKVSRAQGRRGMGVDEQRGDNRALVSDSNASSTSGSVNAKTASGKDVSPDLKLNLLQALVGKPKGATRGACMTQIKSECGQHVKVGYGDVMQACLLAKGSELDQRCLDTWRRNVIQKMQRPTFAPIAAGKETGLEI